MDGGFIWQVYGTQDPKVPGYDGYTPGLIKYDIKTGEPVEFVDFVPGSCDMHDVAVLDGQLYGVDAGEHPGWPIDDEICAARLSAELNSPSGGIRLQDRRDLRRIAATRQRVRGLLNSRSPGILAHKYKGNGMAAFEALKGWSSTARHTVTASYLAWTFDAGRSRVASQARDKFGVPVMMQIVGRDTRSGDDFQIPAPVMIVTRVQRLMNVADEVQKKLEREQPFLLARVGVREFRGEFIDFIDHAVFGGTERGEGPLG